MSGVLGLAAAAAGEQPAGAGVGGGGEVEPLAGVAEQQAGEGLGDRCGRLAEPDRDGSTLWDRLTGGQWVHDALTTSPVYNNLSPPYRWC